MFYPSALYQLAQWHNLFKYLTKVYLFIEEEKAARETFKDWELVAETFQQVINLTFTADAYTRTLILKLAYDHIQSVLPGLSLNAAVAN